MGTIIVNGLISVVLLTCCGCDRKSGNTVGGGNNNSEKVTSEKVVDIPSEEDGKRAVEDALHKDASDFGA